MRYPLLFPNRHSYRFLRKYPFIHFGCAISFYIERPLMQRRLLRFVSRQTSAIFPLPLLSLISLPERDGDTDVSCTPFVRYSLGKLSTGAVHGGLGGISYLAAFVSVPTAMFPRPMFFPASCRNVAGPRAGRRIGLLLSANPLRSVSPRLFRDRFLLKSPYRFSLQS